MIMYLMKAQSTVACAVPRQMLKAAS
jgi:hypothetical protein